MGDRVLRSVWVLCLVLRICVGAGELRAANSSCRPSMACAHNPGKISYPFWDSASCAASPSFVLSNCSSSSAQYASWDSLSHTLQSAMAGKPPPPVVITDIAASDHWGYWDYSTVMINLTWDASLLNMDFCAYIFTSHNLSHFNIPASVNLNGFADGGFQFSDDNIYLFFNCTNVAAVSQYVKSIESDGPTWEKESQHCSNSKFICPSELATTSCVSLSKIGKELRLKNVMDTLACSHFTFGVAMTVYRGYRGSEMIPYISPRTEMVPSIMKNGLVQLTWADSECTKCLNVGGECIYDDQLQPYKLSYCGCGDPVERIDSNTQTCHESESNTTCHGGLVLCSHIFKIGMRVALSVVALLLAFLGFYFCYKFRKTFHDYCDKIRKTFHDLSSRLTRLAIGVLKKVLRHLQESTYRPHLSIILRELEGLTERPIEYSYSSIVSATKSFSDVVGEGGFGVVYKGTLPQGSTTNKEGMGMQIAVKVLELRSRHMKKQFLNEVGIIGRIHHINVVRLLGFCIQEDHEMLVYEYVANGSLDRWLFASKNGGIDERPILDWSQRYTIAVGIARGLSYLHEECRHRTVHCDIKPQNILLDEVMGPKIADFGLSRLMDRDESQVVTIAKGTPGYMAPEFWRGGESRLSTKFDVYSYGMVLLELISGRRNFVHGDIAMDSVACSPVVAFEAAMKGDIGDILDPRLGITRQESHAEDGSQWHQIWTSVFVALWCIQDHPASRPSMSEVVKYLEGTIPIPKNPPQPSISMSIPTVTAFSIISHDRRQEFTPVSVGR